jgi:hypothetical protein
MRSSTRLRLRATLIGVTLATPSACHNYVPVGAAPAPVGKPVRVELSDAGAVAMAPAVGPRARVIDGTLREAGPDSSYVVSVEQVTREGGFDETWTRELVTIPRSGVARLTVPKLAPVRTGILAVGITALVVGVATIFSGSAGVGGHSGGGTGGGNQ